MSTHRSDLLRSLGGELEAQASRVRDLIGASHWLSDGIHKEALLAAVIDRHLPAATLLTHGFLLSASRPSICSKEVDLLLLDLASEGPVFRQSALAMGLARQALAAVSVKATCTSSNIGESVENLASARVVLAVDNVPDRLWCGAFFYMLDSSYNEDPTKIYARLGATLRQHSVPLHPNGGPPGLQAICAGPDHFFAIQYTESSASIRGYSCPGVAAGVFVAHLLSHVALIRSGMTHGLAYMISEADAVPLEPPIHNEQLTG